MLLIILLGVITKLAVVSADCDLGTVNRNYTDWTNVSSSATPLNVNAKRRKSNSLNAMCLNTLSDWTVYRYLVLAVPRPTEI
jgi:hypothetical protein